MHNDEFKSFNPYVFIPVSSYTSPVISDFRHFNDFYKGLSVLNLVNLVSFAKDLSKADLAKPKSLGLWISHRGDLISVGKVGEKIIFMSYTVFDDLLASRRVFEAISGNTFFKYIDKISDGLAHCKILTKDMACMAHVSLTGFEVGDFQLSGTLNFDLSNVQLNGKIFANIVYNLIDEIGHTHKINADIMIERLSNTLERLNSVAADKSLSDSECRERALGVAADWLERDDLYLSKRPKVRQLYSDIKHHKLLVDVE